MEGWAHLQTLADGVVLKHGLLASALFLFVDECGVPTPVPGNLLIVALGVGAAEGAVTIWQVLVAMEIATVIGATILYGIAAWAGRRLAYRYGRFVGLPHARLLRVERWVRRHGFAAVVLARLVPGLRIVTAFAAGTLSVPLRVFLPALVLGAFVYILACAMIGYLVGPPVLAVVDRIRFF